jgi:hypothetical protein
MPKFLVPDSRTNPFYGFQWRCEEHNDTISWLEGTEEYVVEFNGRHFATLSIDGMRGLIDLVDIPEAKGEHACRVALLKEAIADTPDEEMTHAM